jgi:hypothetical protein
MYRTAHGRLFEAGHAGRGVPAVSPRWFLAEGNTGPYFDMFVFILNPSSSEAQLRVTYLLADGQRHTRTLTVPAHARTTIVVDDEQIPGVAGYPLADAALSVTVESINDVGVVVERAMWWPGTVQTWQEAHTSAGATDTATRWALAEGEVGGARGVETYYLLANTSDRVGTATVTLLFEDGTSEAREYTLAPLSRTNVPVAPDFGPMVEGKRFGARIESTGPEPVDLVVERSMYANAGGVRWAAGTNAAATALVERALPGPLPLPTVAPSAVSVEAAASTETLQVTAPGAEEWGAASDAAWLTVSPGRGTGSGTVTLTFSANLTLASRSATLTVAGRTVVVVQAAALPLP